MNPSTDMLLDPFTRGCLLYRVCRFPGAFSRQDRIYYLCLKSIFLFVVFQGGVRMDGACLLAHCFSSPFDDNLSGEFDLAS